jgi:hypothetical protein
MIFFRGVWRIPSTFRLLALGDSESAASWLKPQLQALFLFHQLPPMSVEDRLAIVRAHVTDTAPETARRLLQLVDHLSRANDHSVSIRGLFWQFYSIFYFLNIYIFKNYLRIS